MKVEYDCIKYKITFEANGREWFITTSGNVPKKISEQIDELCKNSPKPDILMARFVIKSIIKKDLCFTKNF